MKKAALLLITTICLNCGDVYVMYTMYIDNQTKDDTIKIVFLDKSPYTMIMPDYLFFPPMYKKLLYGAEGREIKNSCGYTGIKEEEVEVYSCSGKKIRKDIWNIDNWKCSGSKSEGWTLTFVITENDLE